METIKVGSPRDFSNFVNAVIDKNAFDSITNYIEFARNAASADIISGGNYDDSKGFLLSLQQY